MADNTVNAKTLADVLGITEQYVNRLAKLGILEKIGRGEFPFVSNIARFITYQKAREGPKTQGWKEAYWQEKAKHEKTLRQMAELKLGYTQGKYHDETKIEYVWTGILVTFRNKMLGVPYKLAPVLVGVETVEEAESTITKELCEALEELKDYDALFLQKKEAIEQ
ncbi:MAG: type IV toxin-antitoxin system AbiEi family antitoxin domain-containing protein [Acetomicrobium sp.]|nr:type IV toxin-antitoxin system AbiEi family antitoxin domain-containing protein [Acetomicrobium sp.]HPT64483.1 type IV toxin-antitoxin system AbiEi family antitoxin domain-containing protein [Acetomicrobium sp.]